jgi:hypothetical protein
MTRPNFLHKVSGFEIRWYKYMGRDMEANRTVTVKQFDAMLGACLRSIGSRGGLKVASRVIGKEAEAERRAFKRVIALAGRVSGAGRRT